MQIEQKEMFDLMNGLKDLYLEEIEKHGRDLLIYGLSKNKTVTGYEVNMTIGYPEIIIGTNKDFVYLKINTYNNMLIVDLLYTKAKNKIDEIRKAIDGGEIDF